MHLRIRNYPINIERLVKTIFVISLLVFLTYREITFNILLRGLGLDWFNPDLWIKVFSQSKLIERGSIIVASISFWVVMFLFNQRHNSQHVLPEQPKNILDAIQVMKPTQNPILDQVFKILPWILILVVFVGLNPTLNFYPAILNDYLAMSSNHYWGLATAAVSLLLFQYLIKRIPVSFHTLWNRNVVTIKTVTSTHRTTNYNSPDQNIDEKYLEFINQLSQVLDSPHQIWAGLICGLIGSSWLLDSYLYVSMYKGSQFIKTLLTFIDDDLIIFPITFITSYIIGLQVWRMVVIGLMIRKLGYAFDFTLQRGHPDGCEGLAPLGNLCLWNALILSPAGIYLSARLFLVNYVHYQDVLYFSLFVIITIAGISFFAPLWNIHKIMVEKKEVIRRQLDQLGQDIHRLSWELLNRGNEMDPAESEKTAKKLERLNQIYKDNQTIPTWPFNTKTLARFVTSQIVPILSLAGLGQPIIELVNNLTGFLVSLSGN